MTLRFSNILLPNENKKNSLRLARSCYIYTGIIICLLVPQKHLNRLTHPQQTLNECFSIPYKHDCGFLQSQRIVVVSVANFIVKFYFCKSILYHSYIWTNDITIVPRYPEKSTMFQLQPYYKIEFPQKPSIIPQTGNPGRIPGMKWINGEETGIIHLTSVENVQRKLHTIEAYNIQIFSEINDLLSSRLRPLFNETLTLSRQLIYISHIQHTHTQKKRTDTIVVMLSARNSKINFLYRHKPSFWEERNRKAHTTYRGKSHLMNSLTFLLNSCKTSASPLIFTAALIY